MVLPVITLLIGSLLTSFTQNRMFKRQRLWDQAKMDKQLEQEMIKNEAQFARDQMLKKLDLYNKILRVDIENEIFHREHHGEVTFYTEKYERLVRPLLYESFHLLSGKVAKSVESIENVIGRQHFYEEAEPDDDEIFTEHYILIISEIKDELELFRMKYLETLNI